MSLFPLFGKKRTGVVTHLGPGYNLDDPRRRIPILLPDQDRKGHTWVFGTTRVGKTRLLQNMVAEDIAKGYNVVIMDPKTDRELFSSVVEAAEDAGRRDDLILVTPIFPEYSAIIDPLSDFYMPEELVGHITSGIQAGKDPFFANVAYEISLVVVQALIMIAEAKGQPPSFNLEDIKNYISQDMLQKLKAEVDYITDNPRALQLATDMQKILNNPQDYYSKVASTLRVALMELTSGNIGDIIGKANRNRFMERLKEGKGVIMVVHLGSLLTRKAAFTVGKVILSMIQSYVGRVFSSGKVLTPPLVIHIDEAQNVLYNGIEDLFAKAGGANVWICGMCQSVSQIHAELGREKGNSILDNCNTKIFMRVPDRSTADYVTEHLGEITRFSPTLALGGSINVREVDEERVRPHEVLNLKPREFFMLTYSGTFRGITRDVAEPKVEVEFPDLSDKTVSRYGDDEATNEVEGADMAAGGETPEED